MDIPGDSTTGVTVGIGAIVEDAIETVGDHDWFRITLAAGQKIVIALNALTLQDPYLYLRDASGTLLAENDDGGGGRGSRLVFTAPTSGTYYIDVAAWSPADPVAGYTGTGTYRLLVYNYVDPPVGTLDDIAYQMTHGFFDGNAHHFNVTQGGSISVDFTAITAAGRAVALRALQQWSDIIGVTFVEQSGNAQITFDDLEQGTGAFANAIHANGIISSATVNVSLQRLNLHTYMHEIGHALGLGHTSNSNAGTAGAVYPNDALWSNDGAAISIMSYFDNAENLYYASRGFSNVAIQTPQVADILAIGNLYGLSTTTRTGNTTYGFNNNSGNEAFDATLHPNDAYTIFDSGGVDTLDYSGFASNQRIDLNPEAFSNIGSSIGNVVIARGTIIENAIGGTGADTIVGNSSNNVLTGNLGKDVLTGGAGADTFRDVASGINGDTIVDFSPGDRIIISDADLSTFTFSLSGNTLAFTGGSLTLAIVPTGKIVASAAAGGGVQLTVRDVNNDFDGDGRSDILWRHAGSGEVVDWLGQANGSFMGNASSYNNASLAWTVAGTGDFNGDCRDDILWRNSNSGEVVNWIGKANGSFGSNAGSLNNAHPSWHIAGIGDFNGDGRDDILWRSDDGVITNWLGQGDGSFAGNASASNTVNTAWRIAGVGDFNGDGRDDVLWRHESSGDVVNWLGQANGGFLGNSAAFNNANLDWNLIGCGDFNGDGRDDVLWRHDDGTITNWLGQANGSFAGNPNAENDVSSNWHVAGIGDYNGDGRDDILWRSDAGLVTNWLGQANASFVGNSDALNDAATVWAIQCPDVLNLSDQLV